MKRVLSRSLRTLLCVSLVTGLVGCISTPPPENTLYVDSSGRLVIHQEGAPYPASMDFLDQILAIKPETPLPEGAKVLSVEPATKYQEGFPIGWGYLIAFEAQPEALVNYADKTDQIGSILMDLKSDSPKYSVFQDIDYDSISHPVSFHVTSNTRAVFERPLGRGWVYILHSPR